MNKFLLIFISAVTLFGCGGGSSDGTSTPNSTPATIDELRESSVKTIAGTWTGNYIHNDDGLLCEWSIRMVLENAHYANQISTFFKGHVTANITNQEDNSSREDCLESGRLNVSWTALPQFNDDSHVVIISEWRDDTTDFGLVQNQ